MSGIFGAVHLDGSGVRPDSISAVADGLSRYGPDDQEIWCGEHVLLGRCTMRTHDHVVDGRGRVIDEYGRAVLVCDARIDNRDELLSTLGVHPDLRDGMSDGDVILRAYKYRPGWGL